MLVALGILMILWNAWRIRTRVPGRTPQAIGQILFWSVFLAWKATGRTEILYASPGFLLLGYLLGRPWDHVRNIVHREARRACQTSAAITLPNLADDSSAFVAALKAKINPLNESEENVIRLGAPAAPHLASYLGHPNASVRRWARSCLVGIGGQEAVQTFTEWLTSAKEPPDLTWTLEALGKFGNPSSAPALLRYIRHSDSGVAREALKCARRLNLLIAASAVVDLILNPPTSPLIRLVNGKCVAGERKKDDSIVRDAVDALLTWKKGNLVAANWMRIPRDTRRDILLHLFTGDFDDEPDPEALREQVRFIVSRAAEDGDPEVVDLVRNTAKEHGMNEILTAIGSAPPKESPLLPDDILDRIPGLAETHVKTAFRAGGLKFDYSPESVALLDHMIIEVWPESGPAMPDMVVLTMGSYLGETIRRNLGGTWARPDGKTVHLEEVGKDKQTVNPFDAVREALQTRSGSSLHDLYAKLDPPVTPTPS